MLDFLLSLIPERLRKAHQRAAQASAEATRQFEQAVPLVERVQALPRGMSPVYNDPLLALWTSITRREQEVVALVCLGHRNYEIAQVLGISPHTVKGHLENIFPKLRMQNRNEIRLAFRDWDFQSWWMNRHILPIEDPLPHR